MSKLVRTIDRSDLPEGWKWAEWSQAAESRAAWKQADEKVRQGFIHRFKEFVTARACGRILPKEKAFMQGGIGKAKIGNPNPGWRAWFFQEGQEFFVTHIHQRSDNHNGQKAVAEQARNEHLSKASTQTPKRSKK